jgi:hypothetical protein
MRNLLRKPDLVLLLAIALQACAPILSALPTVIAAVTDGMQIVDMIEQHADLALDQTGTDAAIKQRVHEALTRAKAALNAALRAAQGAEQAGKLDQASVDAAFADFKAAYRDLLEVVQPFGIKETGDLRLSARATRTGTTLEVPRPEAFQLSVKRAE